MISLSIPDISEKACSMFVTQDSVVLYRLKFEKTTLTEVEVTPYVLGQPSSPRSAMAADIVVMLAQLGVQNFERIFYSCDHAGIDLHDSLDRLDGLNLSPYDYAIVIVKEGAVSVTYGRAPLMALKRMCQCEMDDISDYPGGGFIYQDLDILGLAIPTSFSLEAVSRAIASMICEL